MPLILDVPLALISFVWFKLTKHVLGLLLRLRDLSVRAHPPPRWLVLGEGLLSQPLALPVLMTRAPRWPTHAAVGWTVQMPVSSRLRVRVGELDPSTAPWSIVVAREPGRKTIAVLSPATAGDFEGWASVTVERGFYMLIIRFYGANESITLPAIEVDGVEKLHSQKISVAGEEFYQFLRKRRTVFYASLQYYVYTMLRLRNSLPAQWVRKEFLPAGGDPGTTYCFGTVEAGQSLRVQLHGEMRNLYSVHLTMYDRSSFPTAWTDIVDDKTQTPAASARGFYLVRIRTLTPLEPATVEKLVSVTAAW